MSRKVINVEKEYKKAPDIFTGKDLDYLKDIFGWHHTAYKVMEDALNYVNDKEVASIIKNNANLFYDHMSDILTILDKGGQNE